jgi:hypothetical protein
LVRHGLRDDEGAAADPYQSEHVAWDVDESSGFDRKQQEQSGDHEGEEQELKAGKACLAVVRRSRLVWAGSSSAINPSSLIVPAKTCQSTTAAKARMMMMIATKPIRARSGAFMCRLVG